MLGEFVDRLITYGTPAWLITKELLEKFVKHPELHTAATEQLLKIAKDGRGRGDELVFITSLITLPAVSIENKKLFLQKHYELLHPNFSRLRSAKSIKELREKEKLAKGLIFLIAEDTTAKDVNEKKRFQYAKEIWYGIFLDIDSLPDDNSRLQVLEQRILHFGKNHQDKVSLEELIEKIRPYASSANGVLHLVGDAIEAGTKSVIDPARTRNLRAAARKQARKDHWWQWLNPRLWLQSLLD